MDLIRIAMNLVRGTTVSTIIQHSNNEFWHDTIHFFIATDRSLAKDLRKELFREIMKSVSPGALQDQWHDTAKKGKGFRPGYISFGVKPTRWEGKRIGTILIWGEYDRIKTESPEPGTPEFKEFEKRGGNPDVAGITITVKLFAAYYNKKEGGGAEVLRKKKKGEEEEGKRVNMALKQNLGDAAFVLNELEQVTEVILGDAAAVKDGIDTIIEEVIVRPPEGAKSKSKKQRRMHSPYRNSRTFAEYLNEAGRGSFYRDELKAIQAWNPNMALYEIRQQLERMYRKRYIPHDRGDMAS